MQQFIFLKEGGDSCSNFTKVEKSYSKLIQCYRNLLFFHWFKKQIIQNQQTKPNSGFHQGFFADMLKQLSALMVGTKMHL